MFVYYTIKTLKPLIDLNMWTLSKGVLKTVHRNVLHDCGQTAREIALELGTLYNPIHRNHHGFTVERMMAFCVCTRVRERVGLPGL